MGLRWSGRVVVAVVVLMRGGKQQDVTGHSAGRGRAGSGDDDDLMIFTEINAAIVQERLKICQQVL